MTNEKLTKQIQNSLLTKRVLMPEQYQHDFENNEPSCSFCPSLVQKQTKISSLPSQTMNIKNPLTAFNYMSMFRPMSFDTSQSFIDNHLGLINSTPLNKNIDSNSSPYPATQTNNFLEEPTHFKINIPIELIIQTIPQKSSSSPSSSQEQWNHCCNHSVHSYPRNQIPHQTSSDWTSKPATSLIRKAQEIFFGNNTNNDRRDVASQSNRGADLSASDPRITNETNKSVFIQQQQQQAKTLHKPFQASQHEPIISRYSGSSSSSCPKRCHCESTLHPSM